MHPLHKVDEYLNTITMYRLVVYGLGVIAAAAMALAATGSLSLSLTGMLESLVLAVGVCYGSNFIFRKIWQVSTNTESWLITAVILFLILPPVTDLWHGVGVVTAASLAMVSKYILAYHRKHFFNPAAIAVVVTGLLGIIHATWWVASPVLLLFTAVVGLLVARKIRRLWMVSTFVLVALLEMLLIGLSHHRQVSQIISTAFASWPLVFMGTVMFTEPSTTPSRLKMQLVYAAIVGLVFASQTHIGNLIASTPEVALVIGNVFAYCVTPRYKLRLTLQKTTQLSAHVYDFTFLPDRPARFLAGQYMEWTLPHRHVDDRGNRRTFTIASSPSEKEIHLGIKTYQPSSSFKRTLLAMQPGATLIAGQIAGDFVLPNDPQQKLLFIAGGIGITPFRSMLQYLIDNRQTRDIVLLYAATNKAEISYTDVLQEAQKYGVRVVTITDNASLSAQRISEEVADTASRRTYISGPNAMVGRTRDELCRLGMSARQIVTDHFAGY
jgi:glycine betaine catabolism B